jgi:hypothetical protein
LTQSSYPFDGQAVTEGQFSRLFRELQDSGVAASPDALDLRVSADASGMTVKIQPGFAIVRGCAYFSTAVETLSIAASESATRIDRIVLRLDPAENSIVLAVLKGAVGGDPLAPTQTDVDIYELPLARVTVAASATNIGAAAVTDDRNFVGGRLGNWSTDTRPSAPRTGRLGYNRTTSAWEWWNGTSWIDLAPVVTWSTIQGKPNAFPPDAHTHDWSAILNRPTTFPPSLHTHDWGEVTGKPSTFPPSSHTHTWSQIASKPSTFTPSSHSHSGYLTSSGTISWANGSKKPHASEVSGSGTYYSVWVDGDGTFGRNTSSRRYKQNIREHDAGEGVLELQPVIYDRKPKEPGGGYARDEFGLIAEEVVKHLPEVVTYHDGLVDALRYDLLAVALIPVVRGQRDRIKALEGRLASLEAALGVSE